MENGIEITSTNGYAGLYAATSFQEGAALLPLTGRLQSHPSRYSVQIAHDVHLVPESVGPEAVTRDSMWAFMNHSCRPNARVDLPRRVLVAVRPIDAGEEFTFDYNTTEWELAEPFRCRCGAAHCCGMVRGFKHLPKPRQRALLPHVAPHISRLYEEYDSVRRDA